MSESKLELYHYWRSSCSWRVRYALQLKGVAYQSHAVNLLKNEQQTASFKILNPAAQVPCLLVDDKPLYESLAIIEWLDETYPEPSLLPKDPWERAEIRSFVQLIAAGIQPICNLRVVGQVSTDPKKKQEWSQHFIAEGFIPVEAWLEKFSGRCCFGDSVTMAELFLIPQVYNALRFEVDMSRFPLTLRFYEDALRTQACDQAAPHNQPGATA